MEICLSERRQGEVAAVWNMDIGSPDLRKDRQHVVMLSVEQTRVDEVWLVVAEPQRSC